MQLTGEQKIEAPRQAVWEGLNDPDVLRRSIPGCLSLDRVADDRMEAVVEIKIGPIGARFKGAVTLSDQVPPQSYTISGEGHGGTVGNARGGARVNLSEDGTGTLLAYTVEAQVAGRLAQLGGPIIDATAKQLAAKFFRQFGEIVAGSATGTELSDGAPASAQEDASADIRASPARTHEATVDSTAIAELPAARFPAGWALGVLAAALIGFLVGRADGGAADADWTGLSVGLLVLVVAAAAFEHGRRVAAPTLVLSPAVLRQLIAGGDR